MKERLKNVPLSPGVYLYKDREGRVIYVGKAKALRNRLRSYFQAADNLDPKVRAMMARVEDFDYIVTRSEVEALILENNLIKAYHPRYNIALRDDKTYPYLKISSGEKFPRLALAREEKDGVSRYFGPYTDVTSVRATMKLLTTIFPLRTCKHFRLKDRPCLNRDMNKCLAPCSGEISEQSYRETVEALIGFLEGNYGKTLQDKEKEMKMAAAGLEFEKAARLRDQIQAIKTVGEQHKVSSDSVYHLDLIGMISDQQETLVLVFKIRNGKIIAKDTFWLHRPINENDAEAMEFFLRRYYDENNDIPGEILLSVAPAGLELMESWFKTGSGRRVKLLTPRRGEKKRLMDMVMENVALLWAEKKNRDDKNREILLQLSRNLELETVPRRIECYDISHLGGEETVASMAVFCNGLPENKAYRRFKIRNEQNNDFASLAETLQRRFQESRRANPAFLPEPDLIIIDGGLGQVNAVKTVLDEMDVDIPVFGLAKKNEEIYSPGQSRPLVLNRRDEGLKLLQRVRDEAHRFAIEYNRQRRGQKIKASALDEIKGIGKERKRQLLAHFGSVSQIKGATLEELAAVPGMNIAAARSVYRYFREGQG